MKKTILFTLVTLVFCAVACTSGKSQLIPEERQYAQYREGWTSDFDSTHIHPRFELFGNVDSVTIYYPILSAPHPYTTYKFNENGDVIRTICYNAEGNAYESHTYEYDTNSNLLHKVIIEKGKKEVDIRYEYDSHNRLITEKGSFYYLKADITHIYDENGNEIEEINAGEGLKSVMAYDSEHRLLERNTYGIKEGDHRLRTTNEYDEKGHLVKHATYSGKTKNIIRLEYNIYDESDRCIETIIELYDNSDVLTSKSIYRFNENGDCIAREYYSGPENKVDWKSYYTYDTYGGLKEEKKYNENDELEKHIIYYITYDSHGNRLTFEGRQFDEDGFVNTRSNTTEYEIFYK
jgi:hypothetical protein